MSKQELGRERLSDSGAPWLCRFGLHRWRHVHLRIPAYSKPEPTNPFELSRWCRQCSRCGATKRPVV